MRRIAITSLSVAALLAAAYLLVFSTSKFNRGPGFFTNLSDFHFLLKTHYQWSLSRPVPSLTPERYTNVMGRLHRGAHWEVKRAALGRVVAWGDAAVYFLLGELEFPSDWHRLTFAAKALGRIGSRDAIRPLARLLFQPPEGLPFPPRLQEAIVEAIGTIGGETAADVLIDYYESDQVPNKLNDISVLAAIGRSGAGAGYVLHVARQTHDADTLHRMLWALAEARDPDVARFLANCLLHLDGRIRQRARDAMDQTMGSVAVDPALDILAKENDDHVRYAIINMLLDDQDAGNNPRVLRQLTELLDHPVLGNAANHSLTRIGGPGAIAALMSLQGKIPPEKVLDNLQAVGAEAVTTLSGFLGHSDAGIRRLALEKLMALRLPESRPLVAALADDADAHVRAMVSSALLRLDKIDLHAALADALPSAMGRGMRSGFRPPYARGFRNVWQIFTWLHVAGLFLAVLLGFLLLTGAIREFEPYRFHIVLQFLLLEGFVGDFFFMDNVGADPWRVYCFAVGCHLLLLMGCLMKGGDRLPGEARNRFERVGGLSKWILVPLVLWYGTPPLALAMRSALSHLSFMLWAIAGLAVMAALLLEQWLIPWHLWRPPDGARRWVRAASGLGVALLPVGALMLRAQVLWRQKDFDGAVWCGMLILPLAWMAIYSLWMLKAGVAAETSHPLDKAPTKRLKLVCEREQHTVEIDLRRRHRWKWLAGQCLFLMGPAAGAAVVAGRGGNGPAMVLALTSVVFGPALAGILWDTLAHRMLIQVRGGYSRCGIPVAGGVFHGGRWHRRLSIAPHLRYRLARKRNPASAANPFSPQEQAWLEQVVHAGDPAPAGEWGYEHDFRLRISGTPRFTGRDCIQLPIEMTNVHHLSQRMADMELRGSPFGWQATLNGQTAELYFDAADRWRSIEPGQTIELMPRLYPSVGLSEDEDALLMLSFSGRPLLKSRLALRTAEGR